MSMQLHLYHVVHVNVYNYFDYFIKVSDFLQLHVLYIIIHIWTVYQSLWSEQQYAIIKKYGITSQQTRGKISYEFFLLLFFFLHLTSACVTMATAPESNIGTGSRSDRFTDTWDKKGLKLL